ncbi:hypothetical protein FRC17_009105 [Serendipita sp. 399]|nr:hypothetical protein FRC17_009105 [Serendipita sp. 399]
MARAKALGGWLNANAKQTGPKRPKASSRTPSIVRPPRERPWQTYLWALQGLLYIMTTGWVILSYFYGMSWKRSHPIRPPNPIFIVASLLWTFWNRVWLHASRKRAEGLAVRVESQRESMRIQFVIWMSRLVMSSLVSLWGGKVTEGTYGAFLAVEVALGVLAMITIKVTDPPPISLSRHNSTKEVPLRRRSSFMPSEPLTTPTNKTPKPTFGTPSLLSHFMSNSTPAEEMDWTPQFNPSRSDDAFTLKPGKLSSPPTGLESLFASASLFGDEDVAMNGSTSGVSQSRLANGNHMKTTPKTQRDLLLQWIRRQDMLIMGSVAITVLILLIGAVLPAWQRQKVVGVWDPSKEWTSGFDNAGSSSNSASSSSISVTVFQETEPTPPASSSGSWVESDDPIPIHANQ